MNDETITALAHADLDFNAPLSDNHAAGLISSLRPLEGARVVDLGCGWAELLLRILAAEPTATGLGVDAGPRGLDRGRANAAERGLAGRVRLETGDVTRWAGEPADVVTAIGVSHAWGGTRETLDAVRPLLRTGGRLLLGDAFWERTPPPSACAALGAEPGDFGPLPGLVDLALDRGYRLLALSVADTGEWDSFESRWCGGLERWLLRNPGAPGAEKVRAVADDHRDGWLRGYRGVLGFAYLVLGVA